MAKLTPIEMQKFEALLGMSGGYVLNFSNLDFSRFINHTVQLNIESGKYDTYGTSKAKRLKRLWEIENDSVVGKLLEALVEYYHAQLEMSQSTINKVSERIENDCMIISLKLQGKELDKSASISIPDFLSIEIDEIDIKEFQLPSNLTVVLEQRIAEIKIGLKHNAPLSVIFHCGSLLEGLLLNIATQHPAKFNQAKSALKDKTGKVRPFYEWSLNGLIDTANELGFLGLDVKKHSHGLKDFRNYIHPFEQMATGFSPDRHTAEIAWKVLKAAMHDLKKII